MLAYACGQESLTGPGALPRSDDVATSDASALDADATLASVGPVRICGTRTEVDLVRGHGQVVGTVAVTNDEAALTVVYRTTGDWELAETHLAVTSSLSDVPTAPSGLPQIGRFPEQATHAPETTAHAVTLSWPALGVGEGDGLVVAAHAEVVDRNDPTDPEDDRSEGAWGEGTAFSERGRGSTGSYFEHTVQACTSVARTVGPVGGTIEVEGEAPDEGVTLVIPEGALEEPVEITIEPVELSALPASLTTAAGSSFTPDDLVEGTAYDFGPDGLEFLLPVELTIGYDEAELGSDPEAVEELLHVFVVDGIFAPIDPSTVDAAANDVSAFVEHFTVFAVGTVEGIDISITEPIGVDDRVTVRAPGTISMAEPIGVSDQVSLSVEGPVPVAVTEPIGVTDQVSLSVEGPVPVAVTEPIGVTDEVSLMVEGSISVAEPIGVTDQVSLTVEGPVPVAVTEPIGVTDQVSVSVEGPVPVAVDEPIGVTDQVSLTVEGPVPVAVTEPIGVTDQVSVSVEAGGGDSLAYVAAQSDDLVVVVDRSTRQVVNQVAVGNPFALATRPGGSEVYVARGGDNAVDVIDVSTNTVAATISPVTRAFDVEFRPDGNTAYVVTSGSVPRLNVIDAATRAVTATIGGLASFSRGMAITPGGDSAFVVANDTVVVIDLTTNTALDTLTGSFTGADAAVTPDGQTLLVTDTDTDLVLFDLATGAVSATVTVGSAPFGLAVHPAGTTAYTANRSSNSITPVDLATQTAQAAVAVASQPWQVAVNEDGTIAWVTQRAGGSVAVVDLVSGSVLTTIAVGAGPAGLTLTP